MTLKISKRWVFNLICLVGREEKLDEIFAILGL